MTVERSLTVDDVVVEREIADALRPVYARLIEFGMGPWEACGVLSSAMPVAYRLLRQE
jgi:hypothetical protein